MVDGGLLGLVDCRGAAGAGALDSPAVLVGHNMLVTLRHDYLVVLDNIGLRNVRLWLLFCANRFTIGV